MTLTPRWTNPCWKGADLKPLCGDTSYWKFDRICIKYDVKNSHWNEDFEEKN